MVFKRTFLVAQHEYHKLEHHDYLVSNDLHSLESDETTDHENCMEWCSNKSNCGGFAIGYKTCYFKSNVCKDDLGNSNGVLYIKRGRNTI